MTKHETVIRSAIFGVLVDNGEKLKDMNFASKLSDKIMDRLMEPDAIWALNEFESCPVIKMETKNIKMDPFRSKLTEEERRALDEFNKMRANIRPYE